MEASGEEKHKWSHSALDPELYNTHRSAVQYVPMRHGSYEATSCFPLGSVACYRMELMPSTVSIFRYHTLVRRHHANPPPITNLYNHRSRLLSTLAKEVSTCVGLQSMQRLILVKVRRLSDYWVPSAKWHTIVTHPHPTPRLWSIWPLIFTDVSNFVVP